ncbi:MAG: WXG100 family type VII secretion target [Erysipelotrichaceae bacterium]|nr:WXG100 family type VII secretion target [Erysipelotrichaceae bacterium]
MNTTINVEPGKLEETAARVEACDGDYQRLYRSLYAEVDKLSGNWGGKDNLAFNGKIRSYEEDFRQISILVRQYAAFLRASARAYREIQDELTSSANRLKV